MAKFSLITGTSNLLFQRYRFVALAVDIAVFVAGLIDELYSGLGPMALIAAPENYRFGVFVTVVLLLIVLELRAVGQDRFGQDRKIKLIPFFARLCLCISAVLVTDLYYSQMLFLPLLVYTYLTVSKYFSYGLAIVGVAILFQLSTLNLVGLGPLPAFLLTSADPIPSSVRLRAVLIDRSTGTFIILLFTLLLARAIDQATQAEQKLTGLLTDLETSHAQL